MTAAFGKRCEWGGILSALFGDYSFWFSIGSDAYGLDSGPAQGLGRKDGAIVGDPFQCVGSWMIRGPMRAIRDHSSPFPHTI